MTTTLTENDNSVLKTEMNPQIQTRKVTYKNDHKIMNSKSPIRELNEQIMKKKK